MRTIAVPERSTLYVSDLDNHIFIDNSAGGIVITATRDNFSAREKAYFIRWLAAEGYIPDRYEWFSEPAEDGFLGVKWIASASPLENRSAWRTRRNAWYGFLAILWLAAFIWAAWDHSHSLGL